MAALQWHRKFRSLARRSSLSRNTRLVGRFRDKIPKVVVPPPGGGRSGRKGR